MSYEKSNKLHIVAVTAVIRNREGKYLVLKRHPRETAFPEKWCFPGGKVDSEDSIEETLVKEIKEEAGLVMKPGKILLKDACFTRPDGQTVKVLAYLVEVEDGEVKFDANDFTEYRWVTAEELKKLLHVGLEEEIRKAEEIINLGIPLEKLQTKSEKPWG
ncbi:MAG: NUDIX domain-containing protein [Patescibacteria group bacterium]